MSKADFMLGADPEFGFLDRQGHSISACEIIKDDLHADTFGLDGSNEVAEIRPAPSENPFTVVANIGRALRHGASEHEGTIAYDWKAGSSVDGSPIGGHIHFGTKVLKDGYNLQENLGTLDRYLAQTMILLEDPDEARERRDAGSYGRLGDHRDQKHGFEYRSPSSWLTSPYIASGVLCLAKAIVWETLYNGLGKTHAVMLDHRAYEEANFRPIRRQFESAIWPDIQKFELYPKYKQAINLLHTLIAKEKSWFPSCGMKSAWAVSSQQECGLLKRTSLDAIWTGVSA